MKFNCALVGHGLIFNYLKGNSPSLTKSATLSPVPVMVRL